LIIRTTVKFFRWSVDQRIMITDSYQLTDKGIYAQLCKLQREIHKYKKIENLIIYTFTFSFDNGVDLFNFNLFGLYCTCT